MSLLRIVGFVFLISRIACLRIHEDRGGNFRDPRTMFKLTNRPPIRQLNVDTSELVPFARDGRPCDRKKVDQFLDTHADQKTPPEAQAKKVEANERILAVFHDVLEGVGLPLLLHGGSALGFIRNCGAIPSDPDIDVALLGSWLQEDESIFPRLKEAFKAKGGSLSLGLCPGGFSKSGCEARVTFKDAYGDIFILEEEPCADTAKTCNLTQSLWPGGRVGDNGYAPCTFEAKYESVRFLNRTMWEPTESQFIASYGKNYNEPHGGVYKNCNLKNLRKPQPIAPSNNPTAKSVLDLERDGH